MIIFLSKYNSAAVLLMAAKIEEKNNDLLATERI